MGQAEPGWARLGQAGPGWAMLGQDGPGWAGPRGEIAFRVGFPQKRGGGRAGPGRTGSGRAGSGRAGTIRFFDHTFNNALAQSASHHPALWIGPDRVFTDEETQDRQGKQCFDACPSRRGSSQQ